MCAGVHGRKCVTRQFKGVASVAFTGEANYTGMKANMFLTFGLPSFHHLLFFSVHIQKWQNMSVFNLYSGLSDLLGLRWNFASCCTFAKILQSCSDCIRTSKNSGHGAKTPRFCAPVESLLLGTSAIPLTGSQIHAERTYSSLGAVADGCRGLFLMLHTRVIFCGGPPALEYWKRR